MILLISLLSLGNIYQFVELRRSRQEIPFSTSDQPFIQKAIQAYASENNASHDEVMRGRFPVVVQVDGMRCVSLRMRSDWVGSSPTICFDKQGKRTR